MFAIQKVANIWEDTHRWGEAPTYTRVDFWLKSAECASRKLVLLVVCKDDRLIPIEDGGVGDDKGHALIAGIISIIAGQPINRVDLVRVNILINAFGALLLAGAFFHGGWRNFSWVMFMVGMDRGVPGAIRSADVVASFAGIYEMALAPVVILSILIAKQKKDYEVIGVVTVGLICVLLLFLATLLREAIAGASIGSTAILIGSYLLWKRRAWSQKLVMAGVWGAMLLTFSFGVPGLLAVRNNLYGLEKPEVIATHGFAHNLYIGLGAVPNKWGIEWLDGYAASKVYEINPSVEYLSPEYFRILRWLYLETVMEDPLEALRIYWLKGKESVLLSISQRWVRQFGGKALVLLYAALVIGSMAVVRRYSGRGEFRRTVWVLLGLHMAQGFFLLQGVLTVPAVMFLYPARIIWTVMIIFCVWEAAIAVYRWRLASTPMESAAA